MHRLIDELDAVEAPRIGYAKKHKLDSLMLLPKGSSATIAHAIRNHWQEESMHWVLDVVFGEDACRKRVYNAAENYSRMMKVVLSLLRNHRK